VPTPAGTPSHVRDSTDGATRAAETDTTHADLTDWARIYLLLTALERAIEERSSTPESALEELHREYAAVLGSAVSVPAGPLLRRELRYARRLLDALYQGRRIDSRMLTRDARPCATLGCGNDALGSYCLTCEARRARF
jgi:hypothetical protein